MVKVKNANVGKKKTMMKEEVAEVEGQEKEKAKEWLLNWGPLLTVNELYYPEMIYEIYANLHKGRVQKQGNITYQWVTSRMGGRDISFDDRILNTILGTPENGTPTYIVREDLKNCSLEKKFLRGMMKEIVGDHIGVGKIYNKYMFKRMGFSRNEEGMLSDEDDEGNEGQEAMNVDDEKSEEEPKEETFRRETRQKKRQERVEGQASGSLSQLMDMIAFMQASMNSRFDALD
ncbi:hypothetical protein M9H77_30358 [Catharanthus roseus]|uniref:Uncharacterized protein n=1 Tax=Catharanthus roseus TaxID=4058 RepID=A0ACB9ZXD5_CATRO|nr:hypothetical protein M9H77_30358 [Catharanthus roseus]